MAQVKLEFLLEGIAKSQSEIKSFANSGAKALSSLSTALFSLQGLAAAALGGFTLAKSIQAAEEQEAATVKLNFALAQAGENVKIVGARFDTFASTLQRQTGVSDDLVLSQLALVKTYGLTNDQAEKLITTANDLSAVTGDSLDTSVDKLAKTYSGMTGELGRQFSAVKGLTQEQLKAGAAVDILAGKVSGSAAAFTNTFGGAVRLAEANIGDFAESIGFIVTQNPLVIKGIKDFTSFIIDLTKKIDENRSSIIAFVNDGIIAIARSLPSALSLLSLLDTGLTRIKQSVKLATAGIAALISVLDTGSLEGAKEIFKAFGEDLDADESALRNRKDSIEALSKSTNDYATSLEKASKSENKIGRGVSGTKGNSPGKPVAPVAPAKGETLTRGDKEGFSLLSSAVGGLKQGAAGTEGVLSSLAGFVTNTFLPGLGGVASQLFSLLAAGPEAVRGFISGFTAGIPTIIENVIASVPVLVEALVIGLSAAADRLSERLPVIIDGLFNGVIALLQNEKFLTSLVFAAQKFTLALQAQAPFIAVKFGIELIKQAPAIGLAMAQAAVNGIVEQFKSVGNIFGGGGGGGLAGIGSVLGFASGGIVPGTGNKDSVPAMLTPGERVLTGDSQTQIQDELSGLRQQIASLAASVLSVTQNLGVNLQIGEEQLAQVNLNISRQGLRAS